MSEKDKILEEINDIIVENTGVGIEEKDCPIIVDKILEILKREGLLIEVEVELSDEP